MLENKDIKRFTGKKTPGRSNKNESNKKNFDKRKPEKNKLEKNRLAKNKPVNNMAKSDKENACLYAKKCGGCDYQGMDYAAQLDKKSDYMLKLLKPFG